MCGIYGAFSTDAERPTRADALERKAHVLATHFGEVEGGVNQMTIRRVRQLAVGSPLEFESFETVPIRRLRALANPWPPEFLIGSVRCRRRRGGV